jgi:hypothetical protein
MVARDDRLAHYFSCKAVFFYLNYIVFGFGIVISCYVMCIRAPCVSVDSAILGSTVTNKGDHPARVGLGQHSIDICSVLVG